MNKLTQTNRKQEKLQRAHHETQVALWALRRWHLYGFLQDSPGGEQEYWATETTRHDPFQVAFKMYHSHLHRQFPPQHLRNKLEIVKRTLSFLYSAGLVSIHKATAGSRILMTDPAQKFSDHQILTIESINEGQFVGNLLLVVEPPAEDETKLQIVSERTHEVSGPIDNLTCALMMPPVIYQTFFITYTYALVAHQVYEVAISLGVTMDYLVCHPEFINGQIEVMEMGGKYE